MNRYKALLETRIGVERIRCHGDYHLGQVLFTGSDFIELRVLLRVMLLEKAVYELSYELNNRPDWVGIPLRGISQLLGDNTT